MTTRQRQGTGSTATITAPPKPASSPGRTLPISWTDWFRHASAQQRLVALGLAHDQGVVYPHQLPATNGVKHGEAPVKPTDVGGLISRLIAGKAESLRGPDGEALSFFDTGLDRTQQLAIARAVNTPDLFLLRVATAKTRMLVEVLLQYASRGKRVLLLSDKAAALSDMLECLVSRPEILALRYLDAAEKAESLPANLRKLLPEEQRTAFLEGALSGARGKRDEAETACRTKGAQTLLWTELRALAERGESLEAQRQSLTIRLASIASAIESESSTPFAIAMRALLQQSESEVHGLQISLDGEQSALAQCQKETRERNARLAALEPGYQAKKNGRFWSLAYWTSLFNSGLIAETEELLQQQEAARIRATELQSAVDQLQAQIRALEEQCASERQTRLSAEIDIRRRAWNDELQRADAELARLDDAWRKLAIQVGMAPCERTAAAVESAFAKWTERTQHDEERCAFARSWVEHVETTGPQLAARLPSLANVVVVSRERWRNDARIAGAVGLPIDVTVLDEADTLTDADLVKFAGQAHRCILLGSQPRLWQALGGDADVWPYSWRREGDRLICQMLPIAPEDMRYLECEPLSDAPDIELCILHRPKSSPCLGQVIFGPNRSFAEAFAFVLREVQEFPLQPVGCVGRWTEDADHVERRFSDEPIAAWLDLEPGVRLGVIEMRVARIEFAKSAGYDRAKAEAWLLRHRPIRDCERTAILD